MAFVNYSSKELNGKIVYYGPGLAGKTTNLEHIYSTKERDYKGKMVSVPGATDRTLFFDYLAWRLGTLRGFDIRIHLYAVPGETASEESLKTVLKGADGVVFVADSQRARLDSNLTSRRALEANLEALRLDLATLPYALQLNKRDLAEIVPLEELRRALNLKGEPTFEAVARSGRGVLEPLDFVVKQFLTELKRR